MQKVALLSLTCLFLLSFLPGTLSSRAVTLGSIEIFNTHEWLPVKPTVYFLCQGENKTFLPDVMEKHLVYTFKGEESWQPLTELPEKKCKRCGMHEEDTIKPDDVYDEWEFCASDFVDGKYVRFKEKEFNATFICHECTGSHGSNDASSPHNEVEKKPNVSIVILICLLVSVVAVVGVFAAGYRCWQKRKRTQDQARFMKLFDDGDDIEDELGLGSML